MPDPNPPAREQPPLPAPDLTLEGRFEPGHERHYTHVGFTVPSGVEQLHVRYDYSDRIPSDPTLTGGNTLDIGLFDERGTHAGGPGFRGWSGSAKREFTVGRAWATPPYRPGPIGPGEWHVLLGPYKIGPAGLDYRIDVWFDPGLDDRPKRPRLAAPVRPDLPPPAEPGWVRADLHCHTRFSDGDSWPEEILHAAAEAGLDVLGITDHNGAAPPARPDDPPGLPVLVPGVEVTTYGGHWNAWSADAWRWHEFRYPSGPAVARVMAEAVERGAFVSVNHPKLFGPPWQYPEATEFHAVEIWNGWWEGFNAQALAHWEALLRRGVRAVALGGSDTHFLKRTERGGIPVARLGHPTTWIELGEGVPVTPTTVLDALWAGRCFVSASPAGPQLYARAERDGDATTLAVRAVGAPGAVLSIVGPAGAIHAAALPGDDVRLVLPFPEETPYLRAQLTDPYGSVLAATNAAWSDESAS